MFLAQSFLSISIYFYVCAPHTTFYGMAETVYMHF